MARKWFGSACTTSVVLSGSCMRRVSLVRSRSVSFLSVVAWVAVGVLVGFGVTGCSNATRSKVQSGVRLDLPGGKAGSLDGSMLESVHAKTSERPPAAIRPDPDTYIRAMLRQYRDEGPLIAREIGRVEDYRPLLGGANEDFSKAPQESYDATSLLAVQKVSEEVCRSLVAPGREHPGWSTILPAPPADVSTNLKFLAQRFIGLPSAQLNPEALAALEEILNLSREGGQVTLSSYIPVCIALSVDAEALLL